ncbi:MAG: 50S ribosomal protein L17 [Candidatus Pacebacteria bacterium]|nr:50S ribosomal protein L17 [Candidatus Paceibacterota bacterium]MBP9772454.1 50S ribosomal protein L17 [Candidatus Paceibacterota bacterium]QQR76494.1 MAG: 50S ribosomal protein L17 [Candidatus Nomurabacteria bacterium]
MRHANNVRKFGRTANARRALLKSLALSLIKHEQITTTEAKAKELRPYIEKLITRAQKGDLATRRAIVARLMNRKTETKKLFDEIAPKYAKRKGGYTRVLKLPQRKGDASKMAIIEFV